MYLRLRKCTEEVRESGEERRGTGEMCEEESGWRGGGLGERSEWKGQKPCEVGSEIGMEDRSQCCHEDDEELFQFPSSNWCAWYPLNPVIDLAFRRTFRMASSVASAAASKRGLIARVSGRHLQSFTRSW